MQIYSFSQGHNWLLRERVDNPGFKLTVITPADELDIPFYLSTCGRTMSERSIMWKDDKCILLYSEKGCGRICIGDTEFTAPEGTLMYCPASCTVRYAPIDDRPWTTVYFTYVGRYAESMLGGEACIIESDTLSFIPSFADRLRQAYKSGADRNKQHLMLYDLLLSVRPLTKRLAESEHRITSTDKIRTAVEYITNHFSEDISLSLLANESNVSEEYFCYLFKEATGTTPTAYINAMRISHACDLLHRYPERPVKDIGYMCGFRDPCYFNRVFKRDVKMTPTQFRQKNQNK